MSCRLAPSITNPIGTPLASVNKLRFALFSPCRWDFLQYPHRPEALSSWLYSCSTMPSQYLSSHRSILRPLSKALERLLRKSTLETDHVLSNVPPILFDSMQPIGNRFATRRISHQRRRDQVLAGDPHQNDACLSVQVKAAQVRSMIHLICDSPLSFCCWAFLLCYVWLELFLFVGSFTSYFTTYSDRH